MPVSIPLSPCCPEQLTGRFEQREEVQPVRDMKHSMTSGGHLALSGKSGTDELPW